VAAALNWLARHQNSDGSWSLSDYRRSCKDATCAGPGQAGSESGATALGLLPFLAAGQTQNVKGPYRSTVLNGLRWLMKQQKDGDLAPTAPSKMYSHGLATIALCEAYGLTRDRVIGNKAQQAILFIQAAQHPAGGWRYSPGEAGDTSVVGWQVMALKSAQMAGLSVNSETLRRAQQFLKSVSKGNGGQFAYQAESGTAPPMTAVGLLCMQYLGTRRTDPIMSEGMGILVGNMPDINGRNTYYWYYATQVMHNMPGYEWDKWNRQTRKVLIESQCREGCATGSWDPNKPSKDVWGDAGGRLMMTSLSALTLEVYYRYLPLYKLDAEGDTKGPPPPVSPGDKPPAEKPAGGKPPAEKPPADKAPAEKPADKPAPAKDAPAKDAKK
jgi:hypothetical protein